MEFMDWVYTVDHLGPSRPVIDDGPIIEWARRTGRTPPEAQEALLRQGILPARYAKNLMALRFEEQTLLCSKKVLVCGCGGLGGVVIELLARAGIGVLRVIDRDAFSVSNLNRQLLSNTGNLSRSKVDIAARQIALINPLVRVEALDRSLTADSAAEIAEDVDLVLDALDNLEARFAVFAAARDFGIPFLHAAVAGWWGQIFTFLPGSTADLKSIYGQRTSRDPAEESLGVLGPVPAVIGSLQALEAVRILTGRAPAYAQRMLYFDGETGRAEILSIRT